MNIYGEKYKYYLLVPGLLTLVCLFLVFFWPGLTQGMDLKGGTSLIIRTDQAIDAKGPGTWSSLVSASISSIVL